MFRGLPTTHKYLYVLHTEDFPLSSNTCIMQIFIYNFHMKGPIKMRVSCCLSFNTLSLKVNALLFSFWRFIFMFGFVFFSLRIGLSHKDALEHQPSTPGDLVPVLIWIKPGELSGLVMLSSGCFSAEQLPGSREGQLWSSSDAASLCSLKHKKKNWRVVLAWT